MMKDHRVAAVDKVINHWPFFHRCGAPNEHQFTLGVENDGHKENGLVLKNSNFVKVSDQIIFQSIRVQ